MSASNFAKRGQFFRLATLTTEWGGVLIQSIAVRIAEPCLARKHARHFGFLVGKSKEVRSSPGGIGDGIEPNRTYCVDAHDIRANPARFAVGDRQTVGTQPVGDDRASRTDSAAEEIGKIKGRTATPSRRNRAPCHRCKGYRSEICDVLRVIASKRLMLIFPPSTRHPLLPTPGSPQRWRSHAP